MSGYYVTYEILDPFNQNTVTSVSLRITVFIVTLVSIGWHAGSKTLMVIKWRSTMLVHVNLLHTEGFRIEGSVPQNVIDYLKSEFGQPNVTVESDDDLIDPFKTEWFKETMIHLTSGSNLRFYRKQNKMTQRDLADKLGTTKQAICAMEHDVRSISKKKAKALADLFGTSPARFL